MENRILKIDLSNRSHKIEEIPTKIIKQYLGGRGLGSYLLYHLVPAGTDPLSAENHLIFTAGPASGTNLPYSSRTVLVTKSPLTGIYLRSSASGTLAHKMKKAGFWVIDIKGIADSPIYIKINNQEVEFKDATHLWGMGTTETQQALLGGSSEDKGAAAVIGPAGEKLGLCAAIITGGSRSRTFGRGGTGCVMGTKKLKAIVISGDGKVEPADKDKFEEVKKAMIALVKEKRDGLAGWHNFGTSANVESRSAEGLIPTKNWQGGVFEGVHGVDGRATAKEWPRTNHACSLYCLYSCAHSIELQKGPYEGIRGCYPEYETIYSFGSQCGIDKLDAVVAANYICAENGIDTISAGVTIGFAMECFERGLIGLEDTDGIELRFGNDESMIKVLKKMINQEGFGRRLAQGTRRLSQEIKGSEAFAMHAKGLELSGYECRGLNGQALQYAISNIGGHHSAYGFPTFVELHDGSMLNIEGKGEQLKRLAIGRILRDSLPACAFPGVQGIMPDAKLPDIVSSLFGEPWSMDNLNNVGIRIMCQERLFNMREGITRQDDTLPPRLLTEPKPDGPIKGVGIPLEELKDEYYRAMGWDLLSGNPTDAILGELEIER